MKKIIFSIALFTAAFMYSQKNPNVRFAVIDGAIGTESLVKEFKNNIKSTKKFNKGAALSTSMQKFNIIADNGLVEATFKPEMGLPVDLYPVKTMNEQNNLPADNPIILDGYEIPANMTIYSNIIETFEIKDYNGKKTVFITVKK